MAARIDPFVDVLLREQGDQLYLLPDEPVTMVKDGKPRKVSRQPLTDQHIYALLVEVAPSESADHIDKMAETEFEYVADRGGGSRSGSPAGTRRRGSPRARRTSAASAEALRDRCRTHGRGAECDRLFGGSAPGPARRLRRAAVQGRGAGTP